MYDLSKLDKLVCPDVSKVVNEAFDKIWPIHEKIYGKNLNDIGKLAVCIYHTKELKEKLEQINTKSTNYWLRVYQYRIEPMVVDKKMPIEINAYSFACLGYMCGWSKHTIKFEELDVNVLNELLPIGWVNMLPIFVTQDTSGKTVVGREYAGFLEVGNYCSMRGYDLNAVFNVNTFTQYLLEYVNYMSCIVPHVTEVRLFRYHMLAESHKFSIEGLGMLDRYKTDRDNIEYLKLKAKDFMWEVGHTFLNDKDIVDAWRQKFMECERLSWFRELGTDKECSKFIRGMAACFQCGKISSDIPEDEFLIALMVLFRMRLIQGHFTDIFFINSSCNIGCDYSDFFGYEHTAGSEVHHVVEECLHKVAEHPYEITRNIDHIEKHALCLYDLVKSHDEDSNISYSYKTHGLDQIVDLNPDAVINQTIELLIKGSNGLRASGKIYACIYIIYNEKYIGKLNIAPKYVVDNAVQRVKTIYSSAVISELSEEGLLDLCLYDAVVKPTTSKGKEIRDKLDIIQEAERQQVWLEERDKEIRRLDNEAKRKREEKEQQILLAKQNQIKTGEWIEGMRSIYERGKRVCDIKSMVVYIAYGLAYCGFIVGTNDFKEAEFCARRFRNIVKEYNDLIRPHAVAPKSIKELQRTWDGVVFGEEYN